MPVFGKTNKKAASYCTSEQFSDGQIYPSKATVATYDFEYSEEKPEYSDMISHDESCEVTNDETLASNVLPQFGIRNSA